MRQVQLMEMERPFVEPITFIEPKPIKPIEVANELEPFLTSIGQKRVVITIK